MEMTLSSHLVNRVTRRWMWVLLAALAALATSIVFSLLSPPVFKSTALLVVTRSVARVQLDERFETFLSDEATLSQQRFDYLTRQKSLVELGLSDEILSRVQARLASRADFSAEESQEIRRAISLSANPGETVQITGRADSAEKAAYLVNVWADELIRHANALFASPPVDALSLQRQIEAAQSAFEAAQIRLEAFLETSRITEIETELSALNSQLATYSRTVNDLLVALARSDSLRDLCAASADTPAGECSTASSLAVVMLELTTLGGAEAIQLQSGGYDLGAYAAKVHVSPEYLERLASALEAYRQEMEARLRDPTIYARIQQLRRDLEIEQDTLRRLTRERDRAWETLQLLETKAEEMSIRASNGGGTVLVASYALPPEKPTWPNGLFVCIATLVGASGGVLVALAVPESHL